MSVRLSTARICTLRAMTFVTTVAALSGPRAATRNVHRMSTRESGVMRFATPAIWSVPMVMARISVSTLVASNTRASGRVRK